MKELNNREARQLSGGTDGILDNAIAALYYFVPALHLLNLGADSDTQHTDSDDK